MIEMSYLLIGILVFVVFVLGVSSIKIIRQSRVAMVERFGKFHRALPAGFHIVVPILDRISINVDMKTQVLDSDPQPVITKDNVGMTIDTVTYYKITDPFKAVYEIENLENAIMNITATTLRDVIGGLELDETYTSRDAINARLRKELDEATDAWGVKVERVEVKNINPPADIREAMEKQMRAERNKRAQILDAEGLKEAQIREAEGHKESEILRADAERESQIRRAEGEAQAIERLASAEKERITVVYEALKKAELDQSILTLESIKALEKLAESDNKMLVPYEASALMGSVKALKDIGK
ncbi:SPFH/Band 7/PHB domain protein (plasmid) [Pontibacillus sp. ALD_SL1]|nr:SPFH domain-containing protein [Pontibacillus sp. ALD_SL1]QST03123.1 SPFH/Band 7/PHB domain protein [Pontibacillus sp. ALD_SL1]